MAEVLPHKRTLDRYSKVREYRALMTRRDFNEGLQPVVVELAGGVKGQGTCLGCHDAPCMMLAAADMELPDALSEFPGDPAMEVCPTRAVTWDNSGEAVIIDGDACISCGLCIARCPYGAISLSPEGVAVVESGDPDGLTVAYSNASGATGHVRAPRVGRIGAFPLSATQQMPKSIVNLDDHRRTQYVRNLLIECGIVCRTRRPGDTNVRMDGVLATTDGRVGVLEIELSNAVLDSPRALLEDVAVLHGRYGIAVENIDPVSVILALPNVRSEYYQVVDDIAQILALRCRTVTVGALLAVLWQFEKIDGFVAHLFRTSPNGADLLDHMQQELSGAISDSPPYPGAYRPLK